MTYEYNQDTDCGYILINKLPHAYSKEVDDARFVDYAEDGTVIGIELLYVSSGVDVSGLPQEQEVADELAKHGVKVVGEGK